VIQREVFFFVITCESVGTVDSMCFHRNNKVHRSNKALQQLGFAFWSYIEQGACSLSVFYNCDRSFGRNHCLRIEDFFILW